MILGGHGDGLVAAQVIKDMSLAGNPIMLAGFLNDHCVPGTLIHNIPVLGRIQDWKTLNDEYFFHPALHKVKQMIERKKLLLQLEIPNQRIASLIHPTAVIADNTKIQHGTLICSYVTIQPGANIGAFNSIRAGANIGHEAVTEDFCYIGPNATMTGKSRLKEGAHLGPNAVITDGITLQNFCIAGAGSAIMQETTPFSIYIGNPARKVLTSSQEA